MLAKSQQVPFTTETFSDPVCDTKGKCFECSFNELRLIDSCYSTGYIQTVFCKMTSSLNNTQEISYMTSCSPATSRIISPYTLWWGTFLALSVVLYYNWHKQKVLKTQNYHLNLANIIKT